VGEGDAGAARPRAGGAVAGVAPFEPRPGGAEPVADPPAAAHVVAAHVVVAPVVATPVVATPVEAPSPDSAADWVVPVDGACPPGFPIKANDRSRIFHVPGGRSYERTVPERCYSSEHAAERDGYRRAKA
jgi:hypothetical protein